MIKQNIVCENAKVQGLDNQESHVQVLDGFVNGFRVYSKTSSNMICLVNATSNNVRFTPKSSIMSIR
jgi:hypothetical protein